jgi:hypothetical protein
VSVASNPKNPAISSSNTHFQIAEPNLHAKILLLGQPNLRTSLGCEMRKDFAMPLTEEEFEELSESFRYNDANGDGKIEFQEFLNMLADLESGVEHDEAKIGFHEIDTDNDGSIELDEFIDWWRGS